jgi:hypothetical protein
LGFFKGTLLHLPLSPLCFLFFVYITKITKICPTWQQEFKIKLQFNESWSRLMWSLWRRVKLITITKWLQIANLTSSTYYIMQSHLGLGQLDQLNQIKPLSVITLDGFDYNHTCTLNIHIHLHIKGFKLKPEIMTCVLMPSGNPSSKTLFWARLKLETTMQA